MAENEAHLHSQNSQLNLQSCIDLWWSDQLGDDQRWCCRRKEIEIIPTIPLFNYIPHSSLKLQYLSILIGLELQF